MSLRILGAMALIISTGLFGIYNSSRIEKGLEQAKDLRLCLNVIRQEIYFSEVALGKALINASNLMATELKKLFIQCGEGISKYNGTSFQELMISNIADQDILLDEQCRAVLIRWSANAGTGDRKSEIDSVEFAISQLDQIITIAEEDCAKKSKLYKSCGFLIGAFVVAVLL